ncbi:uncharacterized protein LTR77_003170 [Saxophila tyrrhenica]|uniref:Thioesterase domain-containing protein n=1 Tax=Saxophila tyrrhenica TaxID=1690608 RepID=A0AAV9PLA4_9PEZI|nr:hypothetical protein LTR77_003170 [Saxophila tyrrhenica]
MAQRHANGQLATDISIQDPKARVQAYIDLYRRNGIDEEPFDSLLMRTIRVTTARTCDLVTEGMAAQCTFELEVLSQFCNRMGNMHGGCVALLADMSTTMTTAPVAKEGFWVFGGVSRTLNVTYLQPVKQGAVLEIECMLRSIGKRLSTTQCLIREKRTGKLLAMGEHGKSALSDQQMGQSPPGASKL